MIAIANNFHPATGIGKYAFSLLQAFQKKGKRAEMVYFESKDNTITGMDGVKKVRQSMGYPIANRTLSAYYTFPKKVPGGYDIYHASSQYLARLAKFRGPCIITHHDVAPLMFPSEYPLVMKYFVKKMIGFYGKAERIIAISESSKTDLLRFTPVPEDKISVILHGVDNMLYTPMDKHSCRKKLGLPKEKKIVLHVGSEEPRKNMPLLFESQKMVQDSMNGDVLLVRVGDKRPEYEMQRKGIETKYFSGIPEGQMPLFYNSADVFVFPSIYEGFGLPVTEAMACGVPAIVSSSLYTFKAGAVMLKSDNCDELSGNILSILLKPPVSRKLSRRSLEASKNFTLKKEAEQTWNIYQEVARTR